MTNTYHIDFEENGGEYTGHITLTTDENVIIIKSNAHHHGEIVIGKNHLEIDEAIDDFSVEEIDSVDT